MVFIKYELPYKYKLPKARFLKGIWKGGIDPRGFKWSLEMKWNE
jgi:hypothetical protein